MKSSSAPDSCHFTPDSGLSITHEQNIICSKTSLDGTMLEQALLVGNYLKVTWQALYQ